MSSTPDAPGAHCFSAAFRASRVARAWSYRDDRALEAGLLQQRSRVQRHDQATKEVRPAPEDARWRRRHDEAEARLHDFRQQRRGHLHPGVIPVVTRQAPPLPSIAQEVRRNRLPAQRRVPGRVVSFIQNHLGRCGAQSPLPIANVDGTEAVPRGGRSRCPGAEPARRTSASRKLSAVNFQALWYDPRMTVMRPSSDSRACSTSASVSAISASGNLGRRVRVSESGSEIRAKHFCDPSQP